ncbi:hypothetical protein [Actinoplanes sp. NPDC051859]|uniref:hypothetical protein n=1 Tax=Actinoplanes sp. NPDC051859 TaxID=3363909 RepID=UPI0037988D89
MPEDVDIWEVRLGIYATEEQAAAIKEQVTRILCPDPDHAPPCPVPWTVQLLARSALDEADSYSELVEQAELERRRRP